MSLARAALLIRSGEGIQRGRICVSVMARDLGSGDWCATPGDLVLRVLQGCWRWRPRRARSDSAATRWTRLQRPRWAELFPQLLFPLLFPSLSLRRLRFPLSRSPSLRLLTSHAFRHPQMDPPNAKRKLKRSIHLVGATDYVCHTFGMTFNLFYRTRRWTRTASRFLTFLFFCA